MADGSIQVDSTPVDPNPALAILQFNAKVDQHLDTKVRNLLDRMHVISEQYNDALALANEFNIRSNFDKEGVNFLDFENSEFQELIDRLFDAGILDEKKYKFETKNDIEMFKARLDGIQNQLKNKNQEPLILIQPLLNLIEQMNKIAKTCTDDDKNLKAHTLTPR